MYSTTKTNPQKTPKNIVKGILKLKEKPPCWRAKKEEYYWVYLTAALKGKYVAIEDLGNGIWEVFYSNVLLGYFNEKQLRKKEQSTRLETNLV